MSNKHGERSVPVWMLWGHQEVPSCCSLTVRRGSTQVPPCCISYFADMSRASTDLLSCSKMHWWCALKHLSCFPHFSLPKFFQFTILTTSRSNIRVGLKKRSSPELGGVLWRRERFWEEMWEKRAIYVFSKNISFKNRIFRIYKICSWAASKPEMKIDRTCQVGCWGSSVPAWSASHPSACLEGTCQIWLSIHSKWSRCVF